MSSLDSSSDPPLGRLITAMATPFAADGALDLDGARRLAAYLVDEQGADGLVVAGTTGESPTLTHSETLDLFRAVIDVVGDRAQVIAGCGKNDSAATETLVREATELGVDGVLLVSPYYNKPSQRGLAEHFDRAACATDLPVLLYDIPGRTAVELSVDTIRAVAERCPNVVGVKDAVGNPVKTARLVRDTPERFVVYAGDDHSLLTVLAAGGVGVVSVAGHVVGRDLAAMIEHFPTDPAAARAVHHRLLELYTALFADSNPVPLKAALRHLGLPSGPVRGPLADADATVAAQVATALDALDVQVHH
ncbi:4-hydroxy-tetrahydrodipicolinate synthase [Egibacter rhizosphaerae]|uniref:4-hydroxy-tetrahydrodipicolinate synthase n=1 Tax=Egibacter rhizosphaerae TaxID=1670831 RepID=A0A411YJ94_9ACTN|nr:4-hydroxy-tetrahydrodipicolinate synthase [Egibacter rhizosphaerae]QBI21267.1 4-hydroxy-tetrahydrodipicolinate synthase [Egibacter rhizosphaerae]